LQSFKYLSSTIREEENVELGKIEDMLDPDERIVKTKTQVQLSSSVGMPYGTLSLTNKRLIFQVSRGWSLLSVVPAGAIAGKDVVIPLEEIKSVKKGWPSVLKVQAQKNHDFIIPSSEANAWVDAVMQTVALSPPTVSAPPKPPENQQPSPQSIRAVVPEADAPKFCGNCGSALKAGNKFCVECGAPIK